MTNDYKLPKDRQGKATITDDASPDHRLKRMLRQQKPNTIEGENICWD